MRTKYDFRYLSNKIFEADFIKEPFKHVYIENFFSEEHFDEILNSQEICAPDASNDKELIDGLIQKGFKPIEFPGCTTDLDKYIDEINAPIKNLKSRNDLVCGVLVRQTDYRSWNDGKYFYTSKQYAELLHSLNNSFKNKTS